MIAGRTFSFRNPSAKVEYALLALMELTSAWEHNQPITVAEITIRQPIPDRYLEHIFTLLRRGGMVQGQRGAKGGYVLTKDPAQITVLEVVSLIEGTGNPMGSRRTQKNADEPNSAKCDRDLLQEIWQEVDFVSLEVLQRYTLKDLREKSNFRKYNQSMYHI